MKFEEIIKLVGCNPGLMNKNTLPTLCKAIARTYYKY